MGKIYFGVVADDFTGASDAASFLVKAGVPTVLFNGIPDTMPELSGETSAVVIALKTRTMPKEQAVEESLAAFRKLKEMGAVQLYLKYCSTFDSTSEGNIGPVADAVMKEWQIPYTVLCPSLPVNGRTVKSGILYVNGVPLADSPMRNHPLTPMRDSSLVNLMEMQSEFPAKVIGNSSMVAAGTVAGGTPCYLIPDYETDEDGDRIAAFFGNLSFLTGGSGLIGALGRRYVKLCGEKQGETNVAQEAGDDANAAEMPGCGSADTQLTKTAPAAGKALVLAGSCSAMTLRQIADYTGRGAASYRLMPDALLDGRQNAETVFAWVQEQESGSLIFSSASPEDLEKSQRLGKERVAAKIEETLAGLARLAAEHGYTRIIVAGGETSGAVTQALGYQSFRIGASVAPGVPVMTPLGNPSLRLVLKSGNFGQEDFFARALELTK